MIGLGTIVNAGVIIIGGIAGCFIKNGMPERYKNTVMQALGLSVLVIGISGCLQGIYKVLDGGRLDRQYIMLMILSLVIGGVVGEVLNIEEKLDKLGLWFQKKCSDSKLLKGSMGDTFAQGFVTASLVYCVGAMAIVGSLEDGLTGNTATLFAKSILDGVSAVVFSATMGIGVAFSSIPVFIYQGAITLAAGFIKPWLTDMVIAQTSVVGGVLIMAIGFNILEIKKIKVGNLLPAVFIPFIYYLLQAAFK